MNGPAGPGTRGGGAPAPGPLVGQGGRVPGRTRRVRVEAWLATGRLKATWDGVLAAGPGWWAVAALWSRGPVAAGPLTFAPGDRLLEIYWADRWYNVFRVLAPPAPPAVAREGHPPAGRAGEGEAGAAGEEAGGAGRLPGQPGGPHPRAGSRAGHPAGYRLKGYYVNLSTPARILDDDGLARGREGEEGEAGAARVSRPVRLAYVDGVLDAVVLPDGSWQWLDQAEFRRMVQGAGRGSGSRGPAGPGRMGEGEGADAPLPLPGPAAWRQAARHLAAGLAAGAGPFVENLVPWDDLERMLFPAPAGEG
ncbi:DUF402 domain-containing protein [Thermaerobacter subterraneus]|uniref:DUF402 domain-containing protein n=1 Tax=Thermaerobacter subterraneus DSM 13965 TaxID=867903 RepID=K6QBK2_9FIRM|nr:DUF402 domain-containing protein [Thermaerobacter subterraneus]EKP93746.1 hypothetical protein ThesuDRAFT_00343 [Thermaerobacter subterraneus DSM 13965]